MIPLNEYPYYSINKQGEVFSSLSGKNLKTYIANVGYPTVDLVKIKGDGGNAVSLHRLLALTFIPNPINHLEVNHIDGNKLNFSLSNLEWVSASENVRHAFTTGLASKKASIPYEDIPSIIGMLLIGYNWSDLQKQYGVSDPSIIRKLIRRDYQRKGRLSVYQQLCTIVKNRNITARSKPLRVVNQDGTTTFFGSLNEAARVLSINTGTIHSNIDKSYNGWEFSYV